MTFDATPDVALATRLVGGVWGHLVGDAVGVPYEFRSAAEIGEVRWGEKGTQAGLVVLKTVERVFVDNSARRCIEPHQDRPPVVFVWQFVAPYNKNLPPSGQHAVEQPRLVITPK